MLHWAHDMSYSCGGQSTGGFSCQRNQNYFDSFNAFWGNAGRKDRSFLLRTVLCCFSTGCWSTLEWLRICGQVDQRLTRFGSGNYRPWSVSAQVRIAVPVDADRKCPAPSILSNSVLIVRLSVAGVSHCDNRFPGRPVLFGFEFRRRLPPRLVALCSTRVSKACDFLDLGSAVFL